LVNGIGPARNVEANLAAIGDPSRGKEFPERMTGISRPGVEAERTLRSIRSRMKK